MREERSPCMDGVLVPFLRFSYSDVVVRPSAVDFSRSVQLVYRDSIATRVARRGFDLVVASAAFVAAIPILAVAGAAIWFEDRGPVFFKQRRVGRFERNFTILKLRTMTVTHCADRLSPTSPFDRRVTRVGRFLRRFSIDELPQFINVLRGEMTLVGPRPEMPFVTAGYEPWQHLRHLAKPGITCTWQIAHRSTIPLNRPEATLMDIDYLHRKSPLFDGILIIRTVMAIFGQKGAY
jgi:lipopolysaccharide/colanic/teichoic acid biosynthesis glycosyltransferase